MEKDFIPELQPLFCSRASLLQAQDKLTNNPDMDCQMRLRFSDGSEVALKITRDYIANRLPKPHKEKYSIGEIISLTEGEYGSEKFKEFFKQKL